jgi:hypothetical protein
MAEGGVDAEKEICDCKKCFGDPTAKLISERQVYAHWRRFGIPTREERALVIERLRRQRIEREQLLLQKEVVQGGDSGRQSQIGVGQVRGQPRFQETS